MTHWYKTNKQTTPSQSEKNNDNIYSGKTIICYKSDGGRTEYLKFKYLSLNIQF